MYVESVVGSFSSSRSQFPLVSATWPDSVRKLAASFQLDPVRVTVGSDDLTANSRVEQVLEVFDDTRSKKYDTSLVSTSSLLTGNAAVVFLVTSARHSHGIFINPHRTTIEFSFLSYTRLKLHV